MIKGRILLLTGVATFMLMGCQPIQDFKEGFKEDVQNVQEDNESASKEKQKALTEEQYVEAILENTEALTTQLEALYNSIPEGTMVDEEDAKVVIENAEKLLAVAKEFQKIEAPSSYKDIQEKYKNGAMELESYLNQFIEEWNSFFHIDLESSYPQLEKAIGLLLEAEEELMATIDENSFFDETFTETELQSDEFLSSLEGQDVSKETVKGAWEYYSESTGEYRSLTFDDFGYASQYVSDKDFNSTTWSGSWRLDGNIITIEVEESYHEFDQPLSNFEKELCYEVVSVTNDTLTIKHEGITTTYSLIYR